ncbi:serine protease [Rhodanobacter panaciterrae]|uniref:Serine protease n=2 Tax=Rhodanobacter panaciterrae TaxID=490572 RepID=A0ABQ2ZJD1_9GAMM|nr:serine protease [Rhodanobacter panaciterrae]
MALGLSACGGGGGNVKPTPPPTTPASPPPTTPPQPPLDAQLAITNAYAAHNQGYTGAGVIIGVVDSGIMRSNPTVAGRVTQELIYVDPASNNTAVDDVVGHGTWVSEIAAGTPFAQFPGGIAPGASLVSARIISDVEPKDDGSGQGNPVTAADAAFFAQTLNPALISAGVQVMNNSWGGIYWDTTNASINQAFAAAYDPFVLQHGGLVVFAAGNDSAANPSNIAALPSLAPELEKGWLVAVAVNSNNPTQLEGYSNKCGVAMNYCLAAPGDVIVLDKGTTASTTSPSYYIVEGTSFAAPEVSGAAALVWQAYPYFTNDLVRQTLLGTADPLGGSQPNPTFGYGELDVGKAVHGPEKFDWGTVSVTNNIDSTWSNPISGDGGLTKSGTGTLTLSNTLSYKGTTTVMQGILSAQSIPGDLVLYSRGAVVSGAHSINGSVQNAGSLVVAGGDVQIGGNYVQNGSFGRPTSFVGQMMLELGSALHVSGTANIGGDLIVTGAKQGYVANSHTDVLTASGGLTGTFDTFFAQSNVMLTASLNYDANDAWLNVQQVQVTAVQGLAYTAASFGAAQRVQNAFGQIDSQLATTVPPSTTTPVNAGFIQGAASLQQSTSVAAVQSSLESLSGQLHAASAAMTFEAIDAGTRALSDRFDHLLDTPLAGGWTQSIGYHGDMSRNGYSNVGYDLSGVMVGADQRIGSNGFAGYALSQSQGLGQLSESADHGYSHALEGMLYGGVIRGSWYTMGRFGFGDYRENMRRQLQLGGASAGVGSDSNGTYGVAYGESGYRLALGRTQVTPYVNLQYAQIQRDGFDELGADGFGLKSGAQTVSRWQAGVGLRAMREWTLAGGSTLSLQTRALWQQSFGLRGEVFDASFSGINQYAPLGGIGLSRYGGVVGTSLGWGITPRANLQLGYDQYLGQHQQAKMATLNFSWAF